MNDIAVIGLTPAQARSLTERIRYCALSVRDGMEKLQALVTEAQEGNAHTVLGYKSWTAYLADTFGAEPLRLPRDQRQELVGYLAGEGMSTRAIAPIVGVHDTTVMRDIEATAAFAAVDRPATVTSLDGRERPSSRAPANVDTVTGEILDTPAPRAAPRRALPDQFFDAIYDLGKATERIARLAEDDRFTQNAEKVAAKHRSDLLRARDLLQQVIDQLS